MWTFELYQDPLAIRGKHHHHHHNQHGPTNGSSSTTGSFIVSLSVNIDSILGEKPSFRSAFEEGGRGSRIALADFAARHFLSCQVAGQTQLDNDDSTHPILSIQLETLDKALFKSRRRNGNGLRFYPPYIVERSDFWCCDQKLHISLRMKVKSTSDLSIDQAKEKCLEPCRAMLDAVFRVKCDDFMQQLFQHVACVVLQRRLRSELSSMEAIAFIADGSILPRKSGTSDAPMASPPAVPFKAPADSDMSKSISVDIGSLSHYLPTTLKVEKTTVTFSGLVVPAGVTLICGGGYHGKSTTLQTIAFGIYDKIPGDGREFCVSIPSAVTVRAEDGRYVNNCNISAFISNLPTPPGVEKALDTQHFSSRDSSGSTSQAANVVEAIEMGATAMLVDEDISAANFMARDGRMRSLVMDESITPLLYRVNGLYNTHKISSVVVVGGVGDWLDVPHNVILLDKYVAYDATQKARSISYQFSYGHVQYAGRGVVHRLEWDKTGTPVPRRPVDSFSQRYDSDVVVSILDGGHAVSLHKEGDGEGNSDDTDNPMHIIDDDDEGCVEASRIGQLLGRRQLFGTGVCVAWLLQQAPKHPGLGLRGLLHHLDSELDKGGMHKIIQDLKETTNGSRMSKSWSHLLESVGFVERPRSFEIGQVLTRLHGIQMQEIPMEEDDSDEAARLEEERKKKALAELWAQRRKKTSENNVV